MQGGAFLVNGNVSELGVLNFVFFYVNYVHGVGAAFIWIGSSISD